MHQIINSEFLQLQHDITQVRAQNLRICVLLQILLEGALGIETERLTRPRTTSTTGTLLRARLGNGRDEQGLDTYTRIVHFLLAKARINDIDDTINRDRSFLYVSGNGAWMMMENNLTLTATTSPPSLRQRWSQRRTCDRRSVPCRKFDAAGSAAATSRAERPMCARDKVS